MQKLLEIVTGTVFKFVVRWVWSACLFMCLSYVVDVCFGMEPQFMETMCFGVLMGLAIERKSFFEAIHSFKQQEQ